MADPTQSEGATLQRDAFSQRDGARGAASVRILHPTSAPVLGYLGAAYSGALVMLLLFLVIG